MDVQRIETFAVPTALATAIGGTAGYLIPRTVTSTGEMSDEFVKFTADTMKFKDLSKLIAADSLDKISFTLTDEELASIGDKNPDKKLIKLMQSKSEKANKALEKFVIKNAEDLNIHPAKGESLKEAAKEYIKGKSVAEIKEAFLPSAMRNAIEYTDYRQLMKDCFADVYDAAAKKYKTGEGFDDMAKMFKRAARDMKLTVSGAWAAAAGVIALGSSLIADKIAKK